MDLNEIKNQDLSVTNAVVYLLVENNALLKSIGETLVNAAARTEPSGATELHKFFAERLLANRKEAMLNLPWEEKKSA